MATAGLAILGTAIGRQSTGMHADAWLIAARRVGDIDMRGVWDPNPAAGRRSAETWDIPFVEDLDDLLSDPAVTMVGISSESNRHVDLSIRAAEAGKAVLCEKPMGLTVDECNRAIAAIATTGVLYMPAFPKRYCAVHAETRRLAHEGELGRVASARIRQSHFFGFRESFRQGNAGSLAESGGGAIMGQAIHALDYLRWLFGEPESVQAEQTTVLPDFALEDNVVALMRFPNDVLVILQSSYTQQAGENTLEVFGSEGTAIQSYGDVSSIRPEPLGNGSPLKVWRTGEGASGGAWKEYDLPLYHRKSHEMLGEAFFAAVMQGETPRLTIEDGRRAVELVAGVAEAARTGRRVRL
jgi:myo-inositol 2-dehydrogenase / D-chiro-inositol 1-dehydrogenase